MNTLNSTWPFPYSHCEQIWMTVFTEPRRTSSSRVWILSGVYQECFLFTTLTHTSLSRHTHSETQQTKSRGTEDVPYVDDSVGLDQSCGDWCIEVSPGLCTCSCCGSCSEICRRSGDRRDAGLRLPLNQRLVWRSVVSDGPWTRGTSWSFCPSHTPAHTQSNILITFETQQMYNKHSALFNTLQGSRSHDSTDWIQLKTDTWISQIHWISR